MKFNLPKMNYSILKKIVLVGLLIFYLFIVGTYFLKQFQEGMDTNVADKQTEEVDKQTEVVNKQTEVVNKQTEVEDVEELKNKKRTQTLFKSAAK